MEINGDRYEEDGREWKGMEKNGRGKKVNTRR